MPGAAYIVSSMSSTSFTSAVDLGHVVRLLAQNRIADDSNVVRSHASNLPTADPATVDGVTTGQYFDDEPSVASDPRPVESACPTSPSP